MRKIHLIPAAAICITSLLASCSKEGPSGATGPAGPSFSGGISGHVSLYDQYGSKVLSGLNTVQLSLNGAAAVTPDASGYYSYAATTGDYNITAIASGYGSTKTNSFQYLADTLNRDIKLSAIPNFVPTSITAMPTTGAVVGDSLVLMFTADTRARNCIIFVNNNSTVTSAPSGYLLAYTKGVPANATRLSVVIPAQDLYDAGFVSGSAVYFAAYGAPVGDVSAYEDISTGRTMYTAVSTTSVTATGTTP